MTSTNTILEEESVQKLYISDYNLDCLRDFVPSPGSNSLTIHVDIHKSINSDSKQYLNHALQSVAENTQILQLIINKGIAKTTYEQMNFQILQNLQDFKHFRDLDIQIGDNARQDPQIISKFLSQSATNLTKLRIELETESLQKYSDDSQLGLKNMFIPMDKLSDLTINIADNYNLHDEGAIQLSKGIAIYQGLQKLGLKIGEFNQISSSGIKAIMKSVVQMNKLTDFSFEISDTNNIGNDGIISVIQMVEGFTCRGNKLKLHIADRKGINSKALQALFEAFSERNESNRKITLRHLQIIINSQQILNSKSFLETAFSQCYNLESLTLGILAEIEISQQIHPICSLISSMTNLQQLRTLNLIIPREVKFDLEAIAILGVQIKLIGQMQSLRISIGESNSQKKVIKKKKNPKAVKGKGKNTAQSDQKEENIVEEAKEDILVPESKQACLRNLLEGISSLNQLEKLDLEIHKDNYLDDEGWECLGDISKLRELRIKLSSRCGISDMSLHGLAKAISNMAYLEGLQLDIDEEIEISRSPLAELFNNPRRQQMKNFQSLSLKVGKHTECGDELLISLSQGLVFSMDSLQKLSLSFEGSNGISNKGTIQFFEFIQGLTQLRVLSLRFDENNEICNDSLAKLNTSIQKLKRLQEIEISFLFPISIGVKNQLGLYGIVANLSQQELSKIDIVIASKEHLEIVSQRKIKKQTDQTAFGAKSSFNFFFSYDKPLPRLVVNTPQGIQCNLNLNNHDSLIELPEGLRLLPENITEYELTLPSATAVKVNNTKKSNQGLGIKLDKNTIKDNLSKIPECFSSFPFCNNLNISIPDYLIEEISFDQLAAGIGKMQFLSELKLRAKVDKLSLTAAQQLSSLMFLEQLTLELELSQKYPSTEAITVILNPLFISKYLKEAEVSVQSFCNFKLNILRNRYEKEVIPISQNLSENQLNLKCTLTVSQIAKKIPLKDDSLCHIGRLLSIATIPYSTIELIMKGYSQHDIQSMKEFTKGLEKQTSLTELALEFAAVPAECVVSLTESLKALSELKKIALSINSDESFSLGPALSTMDNLMNLSKHIYSNKIMIIGSVVLSNYLRSSALASMMEFTALLSINPGQYTLFTPIEKPKKSHSDSAELSTVANTLQRQQKKIQIKHLSLNAANIQGDWQQFELQLNCLQLVFITDSFLKTPSLRSFSLESMLARLPELRMVQLHLSSKKEQERNSTAIQIEEQVDQSQTFPPFGSQLKHLSQITQLDLKLEDFSFGDDVTGAGLCEGINGIKNSLTELSIKFTNQSHLKSQGLIDLSAVIASSSNLKTVHLEFLMNEQDDYLACLEIFRQFEKARKIMLRRVELTLPGDKGKCILPQDNYYNQIMNRRNYPVKFCHSGTEWSVNIPWKDTESIEKNSQSLLQCLNEFWQDLRYIEVLFDYEDRQMIARSNNFLQKLFGFLSINNGKFLKQLKIVVLFNREVELIEFNQTALVNITSVYSLDLQFKSLSQKTYFIRNSFSDSKQSWQVFLQYLENIRCLKISDNVPDLARFIKRKLKRLVSLQFSKAL